MPVVINDLDVVQTAPAPAHAPASDMSAGCADSVTAQQISDVSERHLRRVEDLRERVHAD